MKIINLKSQLKNTCLKLALEALEKRQDVVLVSLLLTLNIFHTFFVFLLLTLHRFMFAEMINNMLLGGKKM